MIRALKAVYYGLATALFLLVGSFIINHAVSAYNPVNQQEVKQDEICRIVGDYATTFMSNRQMGVSLNDTKKQFKNSNPPVVLYDILDIVLNDAYKQPMVDDKVNAVLQFSITYMSSCFSTLNGEEPVKGQEI